MSGATTGIKRRLADAARRGLKPALKKVLYALPPFMQFHLFGRWRTPQTHDYLTKAQAAAAREAVRAVMASFKADGIGKVYWFLPSQTWFSGSFQRPQQLARALAETGCGVVYFEEWQVNHMVHLASQGKVAKGTVQRVEPNLWLTRCPSALVADLITEMEPDNIVLLWPGVTGAGQEAAIPECIRDGRLAPRPLKTKILYEVVDDPSLQPDTDKVWHDAHERCLRSSDLVTVTADDLLAQVAPIRPDALLLPNAVRLEDWRGSNRALPSDMAEARNASVIVGYFGALAPWFDWDMILGAARIRPNWAFVLIGYPYLPEDAAKVEAATRLPNVHYLGKKPNKDLSAYLHHFDVATIPFILNDITHACSPVKLFEYLAGGKPVVTTRMREVLKYDSLFLADDAAAFVSQVEAAVAAGEGGGRPDAIAAEAEANTWRARAETLSRALDGPDGRQVREAA